jgi:hypothetical protein
MLISTSSMASSGSGASADTATNPQTPRYIAAPPKLPASNEGGIAGTAPIVFDNSGGAPNAGLTPAPCGVAACTGTLSPLQNTSQGLNVFGFGAQTSANNAVADDFTLTATTDLTTIEFYMYQTGAVAPSITNINVRLHSGPGGPLTPTSNVLQSVTTAGTVTLLPVFRGLEVGPTCNRQIQKIVVDVSSWPALAAGTYWLSWDANGSIASGPWQPPITICGGCAPAGANAMQAAAGAPFAPLADTGGVGVCAGSIQDLPFIIRGTGGGSPCPANIVNTGTSAGKVDVDDLLLVISSWGPCP